MFSEEEKIEQVIIQQQNKYPLMEIQDLLKLIYQQEYAGGHMIIDEQNALKILRRELLTLKENDSLEKEEVIEEIGNGLCRLNLKPLKGCGIEAETINQIFVNTSISVCGTRKGLLKRLFYLEGLYEQGKLPYDQKEWRAKIKDYKSNQCPLLRHSERYRETYEPAYRVVKKSYGDCWKIFSMLDRLLNENQTVYAAIEGGCCSGKTSLAGIIGEVYDCNIIHMDDFFLAEELRTTERLREVGGNFDYLRFQKEVVEGLLSRKAFYYGRYDCRHNKIVEKTPVFPKRLNIIEGVYSMHPSLIKLYDLKIFLSIEPELQKKRIIRRNGLDLYERFMTEWLPKEYAYFQKMDIQKKSDIAIKSTEKENDRT